MKPIILASHSPRRRELIKLLDRPFEVYAVEIDEIVREGETPDAVVCALAFEKAIAAQRKGEKEGIFIGSDTIVALGSAIYGKPSNHEDARRMLKSLSGTTHQVYTGIAILEAENGVKRVASVCTNVTFRELSDELIEWYLSTGEHEGKAGAYGIQGFGARLVSSIQGDFFNVVGFPIVTVDELLKELAL